MKTAVEELSPTRVRLSVEVSFEELKPSLDKAYQEVAQQARIPGFRPGKVPPRVIDMRIGRGAVLSEAVNDALPEFYSKAVQEAEVFALGQPDVEITQLDDGKELTFTAEVEVRPKFELPDLSDAVRHRGQRRGHRRRRRGVPHDAARAVRVSLKTAQRPAEDGDYVTIDLSASVDGELDRGRAGERAVLPDRQRDDARGPGRGARRPVRGRFGDVHQRARGRRGRGPGGRRHGDRAEPSRSRNCPSSTTTSRSSRASSTPLASCVPTPAASSSGSRSCSRPPRRGTRPSTRSWTAIDIPLPEKFVEHEMQPRPREHRQPARPDRMSKEDYLESHREDGGGVRRRAPRAVAARRQGRLRPRRAGPHREPLGEPGRAVLLRRRPGAADGRRARVLRPAAVGVRPDRRRRSPRCCAARPPRSSPSGSR